MSRSFDQTVRLAGSAPAAEAQSRWADEHDATPRPRPAPRLLVTGGPEEPATRSDTQIWTIALALSSANELG